MAYGLFEFGNTSNTQGASSNPVVVCGQGLATKGTMIYCDEGRCAPTALTFTPRLSVRL